MAGCGRRGRIFLVQGRNRTGHLGGRVDIHLLLYDAALAGSIHFAQGGRGVRGPVTEGAMPTKISSQSFTVTMLIREGFETSSHE